MSTIKDVAAAAGVSPTTVSIIINGRAIEKRIPAPTVERVTQAMKKLQYQPNLAARRLRTDDVRKPVIAFYWPLDYRANMLGSFLSGMQTAINDLKFECELVVQPFENGHLDQAAGSIVKNNYNGVLLGAASENDLRYLESLSPQMPVVLINRDSNKYSTVSVNANKMGLQAASLLRQKGYTEAALMLAERPYVATAKRTQAFLYACQQLDIKILPEWTVSGPNTIEGGTVAALSYCTMRDRPHILYCESDSMAQGALYTLRRCGLLIPQDLELLCSALQAEEYTQYTIPSLSTIAMPLKQIVTVATSTIVDSMKRNDLNPVHIELEPSINLRESFQL